MSTLQIRESHVKCEFVSQPTSSETDDIPDWLSRFLEKRLSDESSTKPYEQYVFELLADRALSPTEKLVGMIIWLHANRSSGQEAWPGQDLIAWFLKRDCETVRKSTRKLEKQGYLSTVTGKNQRSSRYTLLVRHHPLTEIPKRTLDELVQIFHPQTVKAPPPQKRGGHPHAVEGGTFLETLPPEPANYIVITDDDYTTDVERPSLGRTAGKAKRKRKARQGSAYFDFTPEEVTLETVFESGDTDYTEDVTDAEIIETIKNATGGKVGAALLTDDGIFTVRRMMAAMITQTGCDAQSALEYIQGRAWKRIGLTNDRLNCYSLIFKPICGALHVQDDVFDDLMPDHAYLRAQIDLHDYAGRINPALYSEDGIKGLQKLIDRFDEDLALEAIAGVVNEPGGSENHRGHIITWGYFIPAMKEAERRAQLREAGFAPGDALGSGMKLEVPF